MSKNNVSISKCFLEVDDLFGFLGPVVAGRNDVRWSVLSDKLLSNDGLSSSLLVTYAQLGPPLLPVSLSPPLPYPLHMPHACFFSPQCISVVWIVVSVLEPALSQGGPPSGARLNE